MSSARYAQGMANFLATIIKGRMLLEKQDSVFLADCYLHQADDVVLQFESHRHGTILNLAKRPLENEDS